MILHRIVAANVGPFVDVPVVAGPFASGLNVLAADNESGKTTLLKAAGRALFDRHTCKADEIRNLRPAGTSLSPSVTVEFASDAGCFRIEKVFLQNPRSQLSERQGDAWKLVADGDSADERLAALLQATRPGRGATDAAHWGMLGYLWMRQGELATWPEWEEAPAGQVVRSMLVKVEIDPFIETVSQRMWSVYTENYTPSTNQPKVGGKLLAAEEELKRAVTDLAAIAQTRDELQRDQETFERLSAELPRLEGEHTSHRQQADALREAAGRAELFRVEVGRCQQALAAIRETLNGVQQSERDLENRLRQLGALETKILAAKQEARTQESAVVAAKALHRQTEAEQETHAAALAATFAEQARLSKRIRHWQLANEIARKSQRLERGREHASTVERLTNERAELPVVTAAKLTRLEKLQDAIVAGRARVEALGLTVELTPDVSASAAVRADAAQPETISLSASETRVIHAAQTITLDLAGFGTVRLRSGAAEAGNLRASLADEEETLRRELAALGAGTLPEARDALSRARDVEVRLDAARRALADALGDKDNAMETLHAGLAQDRRQLELLRAELVLSPGEDAASFPDLEADEQAMTVRCEAGRSEQKILVQRVKECRETLAETTQTQERTERAVLTLHLERENLQRTASAIHARFPDGLDNAILIAGENFALATYALKQAEAKLPPDAETLPERNRRASTAAEQTNVALQRARSTLSELRGRLELRGSSGLRERENALLIRSDALSAQVNEARSRSRAARLVHDLIERRKQAATRAVIAPLQERLGARFAEVSGVRDRRVFLDDSLVVRGLGRKDGELVPFADLSQGAKEQLLLCLRLAIAEELLAGGHGPQSLILDDVLVNTDAARQERVLTVLSNAANRGLQILICTCHLDRYRGVGEVIELRRTRDRG